jgi:tetratricopeptide (TPR) repeat protein
MPLIRVLLITLLVSGCTLARLDSAGALALHDQAEAYYQQGDYTAALSAFQQLSRQFPAEPEFHLRAGNSYAFIGDFERAITAYEAALVADPQFSRAWYNLAYVRAQILADTVARMHENLDPADPDGMRLRKLVVEVLSPFGKAITPQLPASDLNVLEQQEQSIPVPDTHKPVERALMEDATASPSVSDAQAEEVKP